MIWSNFAISEGEGPQKSFRLIALNLVTLKPKIKSSSVFQSKNKWNLDIKTNFENFDFQVSPNPTFVYILMKTHHF